MIKLNLDWREVLWWMQGGMAGSHLRWSVYDDMVNVVWPQCSEQERRNMFLIMRRDLGRYWRPDHWSGSDLANAHGEGEWRNDLDIHDDTSWMYFRQVLARFDPENQYAVTVRIDSKSKYDITKRTVHSSSIISMPSAPNLRKRETWECYSSNAIFRAYLFFGKYMIDWSRCFEEDIIVNVEKLNITDNGTM